MTPQELNRTIEFIIQVKPAWRPLKQDRAERLNFKSGRRT
jgi:hypothetical protein